MVAAVLLVDIVAALRRFPSLRHFVQIRHWGCGTSVRLVTWVLLMVGVAHVKALGMVAWYTSGYHDRRNCQLRIQI
jgi:hypothetical protein